MKTRELKIIGRQKAVKESMMMLLDGAHTDDTDPMSKGRIRSTAPAEPPTWSGTRRAPLPVRSHVAPA